MLVFKPLENKILLMHTKNTNFLSILQGATVSKLFRVLTISGRGKALKSLVFLEILWFFENLARFCTGKIVSWFIYLGSSFVFI